MGSIIIASPKPESTARVADMLKAAGIAEQIYHARTGAQVLEMLQSRDADLVICPRRLPDMGYEEIHEYMPAYANIILLTNDASLVPYASNVLRLLMPFRTGDLINTIQMIRGPVTVRKKGPTKRSSGEQKIIDDAKQLLMTRNDMTEPEAFRYIQKSSMDTGRSMVESAQMILLLNNE